MKHSHNRCRAIYEPLGLQCIKEACHEDSHACFHEGDLHLWRDLGEFVLIQGSGEKIRARQAEPEAGTGTYDHA